MDRKIIRFEVKDIRFPTSTGLHGSDAMNQDPDYSAAYVIIHTDSDDGITGHGLTFTIGRGNDICIAAIQSYEHLVVGKSLGDITGNMGEFARFLQSDSQLRWLGPEKGVMHLASGAIINALWDLWAKIEQKPVWQLVSDMTPEEIVNLVDFRYITDAITRNEALDIVKKTVEEKNNHFHILCRQGYPAYTTSMGWLGYSDEKITSLTREAVEEGWTRMKMKVGLDTADDLRRAKLIRNLIGPNRLLMMDANQVWEVEEAIEKMVVLAEANPYWIEEPTCPDDILGHKSISEGINRSIKVATGEHAHNRIMFKQLITSGAIQICQIDSCRLAGLNENLAVMLMAAKYDIPVCPHAGGVGLCEYVQHLSIIDYLCVSGSTEGRMTEYVDHLHEHFLHPVHIEKGHYMLPKAPGFSIEMKESSRRDYSYPDGSVWSAINKTL